MTLDQLRTFIAAVDEGSFSAAGRKLHRAQSVVSQTLANLEAQIGVRLFDRSGRLPVLTPQGGALLADARSVAGGIDLLKAHAKGLAGGLEPELSIVIDVMFPMVVLTEAVAAFHAAFPITPLHLHAESLGAVIEPILDGRCMLGVIGPVSLVPAQFSQEVVRNVPYVQVTSPRHPLAAYRGPIPTAELSKHVQLVLTDRSTLSKGRTFGVLSPKTWRLADLGAKHAFLRAGLGWGGMPAERVAADIADGSLKKIEVEDAPLRGFGINMSAIYLTSKPPGPAGRWFIERLKQLRQTIAPEVSVKPATKARKRRSLRR